MQYQSSCEMTDQQTWTCGPELWSCEFGGQETCIDSSFTQSMARHCCTSAQIPSNVSPAYGVHIRDNSLKPTLILQGHTVRYTPLHASKSLNALFMSSATSLPTPRSGLSLFCQLLSEASRQRASDLTAFPLPLGLTICFIWLGSLLLYLSCPLHASWHPSIRRFHSFAAWQLHSRLLWFLQLCV